MQSRRNLGGKKIRRFDSFLVADRFPSWKWRREQSEFESRCEFESEFESESESESEFESKLELELEFELELGCHLSLNSSLRLPAKTELCAEF